MKKVILGLMIVLLFGCSKTAPIVVTPSTPIVEVLPKIVYYGKTSYELKNTNVPGVGLSGIFSEASVILFISFSGNCIINLPGLES